MGELGAGSSRGNGQIGSAIGDEESCIECAWYDETLILLVYHRLGTERCLAKSEPSPGRKKRTEDSALELEVPVTAVELRECVRSSI